MSVPRLDLAKALEHGEATARREMSRGTQKLLQILLDGEWHTFDRLPRGVGVYTVRFCIDQGLVRTKRIVLRREGDLEYFLTALRVTPLGRKVLLGKSGR